MNTFLQTLINSIIQIALFSLIPFIWWLIKGRKECGFFEWIGLKKMKDTGKNKTRVWIGVILAAFLALSVFMLTAVTGVETATSGFAGLGAAAVPAVLVYAALNTALPEEIIFRGFLLKRISARFGFKAGNLIQSILFGLMHGIMFFSATGFVKALLITIFTGAIGWAMGYVNEKKAGGSIVPGWIIHTSANIFSGLCSAFLLFV